MYGLFRTQQCNSLVLSSDIKFMHQQTTKTLQLADLLQQSYSPSPDLHNSVKETMMIVPRLILASVVFSYLAASPQITFAQCNQCSDSNNKSCRPNHTRIFIWKSNLVSGGLSPVMGGAPPQGFAISSMPAVMMAQPAIAIHPASFTSAGIGSAGPSHLEVKQMINDAVASAGVRNNVASAAVPGESTDPAQLRRELNQLINAVEAMEKATTSIHESQKQLQQQLLQLHPELQKQQPAK